MNCADISYLKEQFKLHQIRDVCTLLIRGLACNGIICMLPYQFKNKCLFVFVALRPMSTAMVTAGRSVHLTTLFPGQA